MKRSALVLSLLLTTAVAAMVQGSPAAQAQHPGVGGTVQIICNLDHSNYDDAIVHPGQVNSTHLHGYVGSSDANGLSTQASLEAGTSSCHESADTSGYWFPLLTSPLGQKCKANLGGHLEPPSPTAPAGQCVYTPTSVLIYYNGPAGVHVNMPPEGLRMIAGGSTDDLVNDNYSCGDNRPAFPTPPYCAGAKKHIGVVASVMFPNCIGLNDNLYAVTCPAGYLQIPNIHYNIRYAPGTGGPGWGVDSDLMRGTSDGRSLHADFWQGWKDQSVLANILATCTNAGVECKDIGA